MTAKITHRTVTANGIQLHLAEQGEGPLVVLCHGFPESWYSWRHQLAALANAGFHAVAPDMRGYGRSDRPDAIDQYTLLHLVGDMVGVIDALGADQAVIAGHDWGAPVAWHAALLRPDRFRAVVGLSVPFRPRGPVAPTSVMPRTEECPYSISSISKRPDLPRPNSSAIRARPSSRPCSRSRATCRTSRSASRAMSAWSLVTAVFSAACSSPQPPCRHGWPRRTLIFTPANSPVPAFAAL